MSHEAFVFGSYGFSALVLGAVVAWIWFENATTKRTLRKLEEQGLKRRSDQAGGPG